eukprot:CAMPEP_0194557458 /NCGR_PEP_ID=MMETSP0253-20130528/99253_1 /TAXON_ID=2966 /ORGANISM="Noctiluca scintillans" /LENGTH=190 /DNA_ID=CAMNT_0039404961 /DNA_START=452 /DNA_END=1024 /DNA_ORIENTATION=-
MPSSSLASNGEPATAASSGFSSTHENLTPPNGFSFSCPASIAAGWGEMLCSTPPIRVSSSFPGPFAAGFIGNVGHTALGGGSSVPSSADMPTAAVERACFGRTSDSTTDRLPVALGGRGGGDVPSATMGPVVSNPPMLMQTLCGACKRSMVLEIGSWISGLTDTRGAADASRDATDADSLLTADADAGST